MNPDYPSETFRGLKNNDLRHHGHYRTQTLVLQAWDELDKHSWNRAAKTTP